MPFVVDASVAASWLMLDERHPVAESAWRHLAQDTAVAPSLWWFELRNVLIVNERRGRLDATRTAQALSLLRALPITIDAQTEEDVLLQLARTHRLTVYDAAYLELGLRTGFPLATLDDALRVAARAEGASMIG